MSKIKNIFWIGNTSFFMMLLTFIGNNNELILKSQFVAFFKEMNDYLPVLVFWIIFNLVLIATFEKKLNQVHETTSTYN